jgi:hypothetical protein
MSIKQTYLDTLLGYVHDVAMRRENERTTGHTKEDY